MASPLTFPEKSPEERGRVGFSAFLDKNLGAAGFKASSRDNKAGFVVQSGPYRGKTKDEAQSALEDRYAAMPDAQKQQWEGRGQGTHLAMKTAVRPPAGIGAAAEAGAPQSAPIQTPVSPPRPFSETNPFDGYKPTFHGLDALKNNRITGEELRRREHNLSVTGSSTREPGDEMSIAERNLRVTGDSTKAPRDERKAAEDLRGDREAYAKDPTKPMPSRTPVKPPEAHHIAPPAAAPAAASATPATANPVVRPAMVPPAPPVVTNLGYMDPDGVDLDDLDDDDDDDE